MTSAVQRRRTTKYEIHSQRQVVVQSQNRLASDLKMEENGSGSPRFDISILKLVKPAPFIEYSHFQTVDHIRDGTNARIWKVNYENREIIIKELKTKYLNDEIANNEINSELAVLKCCEHPNIIDIIGHGKGSSKFIALEYLQGGTLQDAFSSKRWSSSSDLFRIFNNRSTMPLEKILKISCDLSRGMRYLHDEVDPRVCFIHRGKTAQSICILFVVSM